MLFFFTNLFLYSIFAQTPNIMTYLLWNKKLFLFLLPFTLLSQVQKVDLRRLSYDELYDMYFANEKNPTKQMECANAYLRKAKYENIPVQKAKGFYMISLLHESEKAIHYLDSSIIYSKNCIDIKFPAYAYSEKAHALKNQFKYREAIDNFILAEKYAQKNNIDFYYNVKFSIAALRSEELGEVDEALDLYQECFNFYKDKKVRTIEYSYSYQLVIFALADAFKALKQSDSATYYNKLGYRESKFTKHDEFNALFTLNEGANLVLKRNFRGALDSINKALPKMIAYKNIGNTLAAYYYLGKAYDGLGNSTASVKNFIRVDSLYKITKRITPEFISGYAYLISYYKNKGDKENQLKYLTQYMLIDNALQNNYKELTKKLQKEYDTPHLILEKETLIKSLKKDEEVFYFGIGLLIILIVSISTFGFYQHKLKKQYKKRFEKIIYKAGKVIENTSDAIEGKEITVNSTKSEDIGISEEIVNQILEKLKRFEIQKGYLESNITIQLLSIALETNSKYVSKIVNVFKRKSFIQYINDLRVDYAIVQLQKDNKLKNYTIQALALEFGFNSAESFSAAFQKKTGIKPTYFIKELNGSIKS